MKPRKKSLPPANSLHDIGQADDWDDISYIHDLFLEGGIKSGGGEGSGIGGYSIAVEESECEKARALILGSHRYRTGDLHVFLFAHPGACGRGWHEEDRAALSDWRGRLRARENLMESRTTLW